MPKPKENETKDEFIERCIPIVIREGKNREQAYVICKSLWTNKVKNKLSKMEERKPIPNIKEIELIIDDEDENFLSAMGFVNRPAIEQPLVYFNKDKENYIFGKVVDEEERIIISPALIPNKRIYRYDPYTNEEYYVYFTKDTIKNLSQSFLISGNHINATEEHENPIKGVHLIYSWIVENQQDQLMTKYNYKGIPNGTWVVGYKILNDNIWNKIKKGEITGVSIEAWLSEKYDEASKTDKDKEIVEKIKDIIKEI